MNISERISTVANWMLASRYSVIPIGKNTKSPTIKWKKLIDKPMDKWVYPGDNVALLTGEHNRVVVVDCDSYESYTGWLKTKTLTPLRVRTGRGMHFYYQYPGEYVKSDSHINSGDGFSYDVKGDRSYVLFPPSVKDGHQYQICICGRNPRGTFLSPESLPKFDMKWRPERIDKPGAQESERKIRNVEGFISKIEAVEGNGGDKDTYRVCCKLAESGLSMLESYEALQNWNQKNAIPPWEDHDLRRKLELAFEAN